MQKYSSQYTPINDTYKKKRQRESKDVCIDLTIERIEKLSTDSSEEDEMKVSHYFEEKI